MMQESMMAHPGDRYRWFCLGGLPSRWAGGCLLAALFVAAVGCRPRGPDVQFVEGRVTLDGQPLANATIGFTCTETPGIAPAFGTTDESGVYRLTSIGGEHQRGACIGTFVVTVSKFETEQSKTNEDGSPAAAPPKATRIVPEVYEDVSRSPLRATVQRGANKGPVFDFDVATSPPKKP